MMIKTGQPANSEFNNKRSHTTKIHIHTKPHTYPHSYVHISYAYISNMYTTEMPLFIIQIYKLKHASMHTCKPAPPPSSASSFWHPFIYFDTGMT